MLRNTVVSQTFWLAALALPIAALAFAAPEPTEGDAPVAPRLEGIGELHHPITTSNQEAQRFFDQALTLLYAFNHVEAERSFREASRLDPEAPMPYWGQALALGPNINDPIPDQDREQRAWEAAQEALERIERASHPERALIEALEARFSPDEDRDRQALNLAYAERMRKVARDFPDDPDVQVLFVAALMNTTPWDYWVAHGSEPRPVTGEFVAVLEKVMADYPDHPGAHHYYIHAVEASDNPDRGIPSAAKLGGLVPVAGHLVHMPSHIWIRVGRYADAAKANEDAIVADEDYLSQCRAQGLYPIGYYPHNIHFLWAALTMQGRGAEALEAARKVASKHDHDHMSMPGFGFPHLLRSLPLFAMTRFGDWEGILAEPEPGEAYSFPRGVRHFARGMAFRARGDVAAAQAELNAIGELLQDPTLAELKIFDLNSLDKLLTIGRETLVGEIAALQGDYDRAEERLRRAIEVEDGLLYSEPPDWPQPARHSLGAILLAAGKPADAEAVYREDLKRHRRNGWALYGLVQALEAQGKTGEAERVKSELAAAWTEADVELTGSRF